MTTRPNYAIFLIAALALAGCAANTTSRPAVASGKSPHDHWKAPDCDGCCRGGAKAMGDHRGFGPLAFLARHWQHHMWMRHHRHWRQHHRGMQDRGPMRHDEHFDRDGDSHGRDWDDFDGHTGDGQHGGGKHGDGPMPDHDHSGHSHSTPSTQPSPGGR